jgi:hypothetical protein
LNEVEHRIWLELKAQVDASGLFTGATLSAFRLLHRCLALLEQGAGLPPSAISRLLQSAASQLHAFGLTPAAADRLGLHVQQERGGDDWDTLAKFKVYPGKPQFREVPVGGRRSTSVDAVGRLAVQGVRRMLPLHVR